MKIGLALSGGAARGMAHVGVLRALVEHGIRIDCIAGTSAGSIVGGAFAAGMSIDEIADLGRKLRWRHVGRITLSRLGVQTNARLEKFMRERLPITKFEDLPIPFAAVATDLKTGEPVVMKDEGDVPFAIRASCTVPGWYVPVKDREGRQLVDGGLVAVIPAAVTRALGADLVISVDVNSAGATFLPTFLSSSGSVFGVLLQSMMLVQKSVCRQHCELSDLVITPEIGHIRWDQVRRADELMAAGYEAGLESILKVRALIDRVTTDTTDFEKPISADQFVKSV
jgi:NTE family protein